MHAGVVIEPASSLSMHVYFSLCAGGPVHVGMVDEAASGQLAFLLQMSELYITMIPIGDVHYIENRQCQDAVVIGSFSHADPGVELALGVSPPQGVGKI